MDVIVFFYVTDNSEVFLSETILIHLRALNAVITCIQTQLAWMLYKLFIRIFFDDDD